MEELPIRVDNLGLGLEPVLAARTGHAVHVHHAGHVPSYGEDEGHVVGHKRLVPSQANNARGT